MLRHVVLFEFDDEVDPARREAIMADLGALQDEIPEIQDYSWGTNTSAEGLDRGFSWGFVMELEDAAARERYLQHPAHVRLAEEVVFPALKNGRDSIIVFDYEL